MANEAGSADPRPAARPRTRFPHAHPRLRLHLRPVPQRIRFCRSQGRGSPACGNSSPAHVGPHLDCGRGRGHHRIRRRPARRPVYRSHAGRSHAARHDHAGGRRARQGRRSLEWPACPRRTGTYKTRQQRLRLRFRWRAGAVRLVARHRHILRRLGAASDDPAPLRHRQPSPAQKDHAGSPCSS